MDKISFPDLAVKIVLWDFIKDSVQYQNVCVNRILFIFANTDIFICMCLNENASENTDTFCVYKQSYTGKSLYVDLYISIIEENILLYI